MATSLLSGWLLVLAVPSGPAATTRPALPLRAVSAHYELRGDIDAAQAADLAHLLDQAYGQLHRLLGRTPPPGRRLVVNVLAGTEAPRPADPNRPAAGGVFDYSDRQCYLLVQPTAYYTRHLLLHEITHQFVCEAFGRSRDPLPAWLSEGLAEYVGHHHWDGRQLAVGQVDIICAPGDDRLARCQALLAQGRLRVEDIVRSATEDRAPAWALVHVLLSDGRFRPLVDRYLQQAVASPAEREPDSETSGRWFEAIFGPCRPLIQESLERLVRAHSRPWEVLSGDWQRRGRHIQGHSLGPCALLISRRHDAGRLRRIRLSVESADWPATTAGVVLDYQTPEHFAVLEIVEGRFLRYRRRSDGSWRDLKVLRLAPPCEAAESVALQVDIEPQRLNVAAGRRSLWTIDRPADTAGPRGGRLGLIVQAGRADFTDPDVSPLPEGRGEGAPDLRP